MIRKEIYHSTLASKNSNIKISVLDLHYVRVLIFRILIRKILNFFKIKIDLFSYKIEEFPYRMKRLYLIYNDIVFIKYDRIQ